MTDHFANPPADSQDLSAGQRGLLSLISLGPGDIRQMTVAAQTALRSAETVVGYQVYIDLVEPLLSPEQQVIRSPIGSEIERAQQAIAVAGQGQKVALISSGDIGIYGMASPLFEILDERRDQAGLPEVEVYPGVSAIQAAAARLGAPLGHDFCTISLSDLLTPWPVIERRIEAAAWGDFVIGFYNPRSKKRNWQLQRAIDILLAYRSGATPVAIVRNVTRPDEQGAVTTLSEAVPADVDMFSLVLVGNSQTCTMGRRMVTPRGYMDKDDEARGPGKTDEGPGRAPQSWPPASQKPTVYPVSLTKMAGALAVVVGGGPVGQRKIRGLLQAGLNVRLISPEVTTRIKAWADAGELEWHDRAYRTGDLRGAQLVFAATNSRAANARIALEAEKSGLLCNVVDKPEAGTFHVPAVHRQPGLVVAVSTAGESPGRSRHVRDEIAQWLSEAE